MSAGPEVVFIDPRVARTMPDQDPDDRLTGYVRQDVYEKAVRSTRATETIVQIMIGPDDRLVSLSSWGRVFALVAMVEGEPPTWEIIAEPIQPEALDS